MFDINKYFESISKYKKITNDLTKNNYYILNSSTNIQKLLLVNLFKKENKTIVVVYPNIYQATIAYNDMLELIEAESLSFFPVEDMIASELVSSSNYYRLERIKTIYKMIHNIPQIIVTTAEGIMRNVINKQLLNSAVIHLKEKMTYYIKFLEML